MPQVACPHPLYGVKLYELAEDRVDAVANSPLVSSSESKKTRSSREGAWGITAGIREGAYPEDCGLRKTDTRKLGLPFYAPE